MNQQLRTRLTALLRNYATDLRVRIAVRHDAGRPGNVEDMLELTAVEGALVALEQPAADAEGVPV